MLPQLFFGERQHFLNMPNTHETLEEMLEACLPAHAVGEEQVSVGKIIGWRLTDILTEAFNGRLPLPSLR